MGEISQGEADHVMPRADVTALAFMGFAVVYEYTIYSASILPYIQSLSDNDQQASLYYSLVISLPAAFQVVISSSCGFLARRITMKRVFFLLQTSAVLGILIYAFAEWPLKSPWAIIFGKCLSGANGSNVGLTLAYVASMTKDKYERTARISNLRTFTIFATFPSSVMAIILSIPALEVKIGGYTLNAYTYPAWSSIILQLISIVVNLFFVRMIEKEQGDDMEHMQSKPGVQTKGLYFSKGVFMIFLIFFFNGFFLSHMIYTIPIVMQDGYGWSIIQYAPVWVGISFVGIAGVQVAKYAGKKLDQYHYLIIVPSIGYLCVMCCFAAVGAVGVGRLPTGMGETFFLFAAETSFGVFQVLQTTCSSIFSHVIPPQYIVKMMPLTSAMFSMGKIVGPIFCEAEAKMAGMGMIFYTLLVFSAILMFVSIALNNHFQSLEMRAASLGESVPSTPLRNETAPVVNSAQPPGSISLDKTPV